MQERWAASESTSYAGLQTMVAEKITSHPACVSRVAAVGNARCGQHACCVVGDVSAVVLATCLRCELALSVIQRLSTTARKVAEQRFSLRSL